MQRRGWHPGRLCGPCQLCGQNSIYYTHPTSFTDTIKQRLHEIERDMDGDSCVCKACERDIKRHDGYQPRWRYTPKDDKCILVTCNTNNSNIHTGLVTKQQVSELLHEPVSRSPTGQLTPLCQFHYKNIHHLLHADLYQHSKCSTCNAHIKGPTRYCPNPVVIKQHFSNCGDTEINITDRDVICTNCYNSHLQILHHSQGTSTDEELCELLGMPAPIDPNRLAEAMQEVIANVGAMLLKGLAILLPEVFQH